MKDISVKEMMLIGLFSALIAVGAIVKLQIFAIAFTLQFLFVMLAGISLGARNAGLSVLIYTLIGLAGFPVFSGGGGISYVFSPSFGYIIGFFFAAVLIGKYAGPNSNAGFFKTLLVNVLGLAIIDIIGVVYWYGLSQTVLGAPQDIIYVIEYGCLVFLPKDLFFCFAGASIGVRLKNIVGLKLRTNKR